MMPNRLSVGAEADVELRRYRRVLGLMVLYLVIALLGACGTSGHSEEVGGLSFSPDGNYLVTASHDETARLWDAKTGQEVRRFVGHSGSVYRARFTNDGQRVVTSGADGIRFWDANNGQEISHINFYGRELAISPDGKHLAATNYTTTVGVWEIATQQLIRSVRPSEFVSGFEFSQDSGALIFCDSGGNVNVLDLKGGEVKRFPLAGKRIETIVPLANSPLLLLGDDEGYVHFWNLQSGTEERNFKVDQFLNMYLLPNGQVLSSGYSGFNIWSLKDGTVLRQFPGDSVFIAISPDGTRIASVDGCNNNVLARMVDSTRNVRIWELATGKTLLQISYKCPVRVGFG